MRKETRCCHIAYSLRLTARVLLCAPSHRQDSTYHVLCYTSRGAPRPTPMPMIGAGSGASYRTVISHLSLLTAKTLFLNRILLLKRVDQFLLPHTSTTHSSTLRVILAAGARCSSVVRAFARGAMGRRIDPSWGGPIELILVPASAPRLVKQRSWYVLSCLWDGTYKCC